jgi:hypothetical protein
MRSVGEDARRRAVQLDEVEAVGAQVAARAVGPGAKGVERVGLGTLLDAAAHLRGDRDLEVRAACEVGADELLAAAVAVDVRGVEEGHTGLRGGVEDRVGVGLRDVAPVRAELPGAEADDRDGAVERGECARSHGMRLVERGGEDACVLDALIE